MLFYDASATDGKKTSYPFFISNYGHFFRYFYPTIVGVYGVETKKMIIIIRHHGSHLVVPRTPSNYDQREGSREPPSGFPDVEK